MTDSERLARAIANVEEKLSRVEARVERREKRREKRRERVLAEIKRELRKKIRERERKRQEKERRRQELAEIRLFVRRLAAAKGIDVAAAPSENDHSDHAVHDL